MKRPGAVDRMNFSSVGHPIVFPESPEQRQHNTTLGKDASTLGCCVDTIQSNNIDKINNEELSKVNNWLVTYKLSLNFNKTKYMQFHKAPKHVPHLHLQINNNEISRVETFNSLGLQINDNLKWITHIDHISQKMSRIIGLLNRMKMIFPHEILLSIYNTRILPHLNYCILSWGKYCEPIK